MAASRSAVRVTPALLLLLCVVILRSCSVDVRAVTRSADVSALNELKSGWLGSGNLNWTGDPCDNLWIGVTCNYSSNSDSTVTQLTLEDRSLAGTLSSAIGGLTNLQGLDLSRNGKLGGQLPAELGQLAALESLSLQWCNFSGPIPSELGNLGNLLFFGLNGNMLSGSIPNTLGLLTQVSWLDLSVNNLTGNIPVSSSPGSNGIGLDNMTFVKHFHFNNNLLSGSLPPEIFLPSNLIHVIVHHNNLGPNIPPTLADAQLLSYLRLDYNQFSGNVPRELSNVTTLVNLNLQNNLFSGMLPDLSNLTNLEMLDVSHNQLTAQKFPSWMKSLPALQSANLAMANIIGTIDTDVFGLPNLQYLNLTQNHINGTLAFNNNTTQTLETLDVSNNGINGFSGDPQDSGMNISDLTILLAGNPLCSNPFLRFQQMSCGETSALGSWSAPSNSSCRNQCNSNKQLNRKTCACAYPFQVELVLTAPSFANLTDDRALNIEGEIATKMTSQGIFPLNVNQVVITRGYGTSYSFYELVLLFFPAIGDSLSYSNDTVIVTALNQRRIQIAEGPFQVSNSPTTVGPSKSLGRLAIGAIVGIVLGGVVLIAILVGYAVIQKKRADKAVMSLPFASWGGGSSEFGEAPKLKGSRWFSLAELKLATNNWSAQNQIGEGVYGRVYKGVLKSGDVVAIKRAREESMQGANEFKNEIELLSRVHHRNLVGLLGFCYESGEQALIYDFMSNGTLRDHLGGQGDTRFSWQERLDIALGSARGLAYLHDHANPPIIHRDVKSSNILLNDKRVAKVADFGICKLGPEEGEKKVYSEHVKGTLGYLDPEYHKTHELTDKSDVYSFGVVLLELLTAQAPIVGGKYVVCEFHEALKMGDLTELRQLLDPELKDLSDAQLDEYLKIALTCVEESGADRQSMAVVVKELERLGAQTDRNPGERKLDVDFEGDNDGLYPAALPADAKETNDPNFQYTGILGQSSMLRSSFRAVASRLATSPGDRRLFSPLSHRADEDDFL